MMCDFMCGHIFKSIVITFDVQQNRYFGNLLQCLNYLTFFWPLGFKKCLLSQLSLLLTLVKFLCCCCIFIWNDLEKLNCINALELKYWAGKTLIVYTTFTPKSQHIVEYQKSANLKSANFWNPHAFTNVNSEIQS